MDKRYSGLNDLMLHFLNEVSAAYKPLNGNEYSSKNGNNFQPGYIDMRAAGTGNSGISFGGSRGDSSVGNNSNGPKSTGANKMPVSNTAPNANSPNQSPNPNGLNTSGVQPTEGIHMPNSGLGSGLGGPSKGRSNIGNLLKSGRNLGSTSVPNDSARERNNVAMQRIGDERAYIYKQLENKGLAIHQQDLYERRLNQLDAQNIKFEMILAFLECAEYNNDADLSFSDLFQRLVPIGKPSFY